MPSDELVRYVDQARAAGMDDSSIRQTLLSQGWSGVDVDAALRTNAAPAQPVPVPLAAIPIKKLSKKVIIVTVIVSAAVAAGAYLAFAKYAIHTWPFGGETAPATLINTTSTTITNTGSPSGWQTFKDSALEFEFNYPEGWYILVNSTTNEEDITLSPVVINQEAIFPTGPTLSVDYLITDNEFHSDFTSPDASAGGYVIEPIQVDRYSGNYYVTTSTATSTQGDWFTERMVAYAQRGNRSGITLTFARYSTSSDFSVADDTALFKAIIASVKFDTTINGLTDATSENNDKQKYEVFTLGLVNDLEFYYDDHKTFPDSLTAVMSYNDELMQQGEPSSTQAEGQLVESLLPDFSYSVSPDHKSYQLGVSMQTTLVVDPGAASHFNSKAAGWENGFDATDTTPCRPSDTGIWCYDLVYSAQGAAPLSATSSIGGSKSSGSPAAGSAAACDSICITAPEAGSVVSPSSTLTVIVAVAPTQSVKYMTLQTQIGSSAILTKPPYTFQLSVPGSIQTGTYAITAVAMDSNQTMVYSPQITVNIGPSWVSDALDSQRVADLHVVQAALELYYNKCGNYPGAAAPSNSCPSFTQVSTWAGMSKALLGTSGLSPQINSIPQDPTPGATYYYGTDATGSNYIIAAKLQNSSAFESTYQPPSLTGMTVAGLTSCAPPFYCVSL